MLFNPAEEAERAFVEYLSEEHRHEFPLDLNGIRLLTRIRRFWDMASRIRDVGSVDSGVVILRRARALCPEDVPSDDRTAMLWALGAGVYGALLLGSSPEQTPDIQSRLEEFTRDLSRTLSTFGMSRAPHPSGREVARFVASYFYWCGASVEMGSKSENEWPQTREKLRGVARRVQASLFADIRATEGALSLLLQDDSGATAAPEALAEATAARFRPALHSYVRVIAHLLALESQQRSIATPQYASQTLARASQALIQRMRSRLAASITRAEQMALLDIEDVLFDEELTTDRILASAPRNEDMVRSLRRSAFHDGPTGTLRSAALDLMRSLTSVSAAQVTGFIRNPAGRDDDRTRSYRQIADHVRIPFMFPARNSDPDRQSVETPLADWMADARHRALSREREERFLRALQFVWPARQGVPLASLRRLFKSKRQPGDTVVVPDGEVNFLFMLAVLDIARSESTHLATADDDQFAKLDGWLSGADSAMLRTRLNVAAVALDSTPNWRNTEFWTPGVFADLLDQMGVTAAGAVNLDRCLPLFDFLLELESGEHPLLEGVRAPLTDKLRGAATRFAGTFRSVLADLVSGPIVTARLAAVANGYLADRDNVLSLEELSVLQRVSFFPEMLLRIDPASGLGESASRTLFFVVTRWDFDDEGNNDIPSAFFGGTFIGIEDKDFPISPVRVQAALTFLDAILGPLLSAAVAQIIIEGTSQAQLTERERQLRRQISHTIHNEVLWVRSQFDINMRSLYDPFRAVESALEVGKQNALARLIRTLDESGRERLSAFAAGLVLDTAIDVPWIRRLIASVATGNARQSLQEFGQFGLHIKQHVGAAEAYLGQLSEISRVLARLSEEGYSLQFVVATRELTRRTRTVADVIRASIIRAVEIACWKLSTMGANESRFALLLRNFPNMRYGMPIGLGAMSDPSVLSKARFDQLLSEVFVGEVDVTFECDDALAVVDEDSRLILAELFLELMTNCLKGLRRSQPSGRGVISIVVATDSGGIREITWLNSSDAMSGRGLQQRQTRGGQGVAFLAECANAIRWRGRALELETEYQESSGLAVIRIA